MRKLVFLLVSLGVLAWVVNGYLKSSGRDGLRPPAEAKQTLDDMKQKAKQLEVEAQKRADDAARSPEN
jgi:hypothetical protein